MSQLIDGMMLVTKAHLNGALAHRKIEREMVKACAACRSWAGSNTKTTPFVTPVTYGKLSGRVGVSVFLHGNHIAEVVDGQVLVNVETLTRWPSNTTKSRLRALGVNLVQKNFELYIDGKLVL